MQLGVLLASFAVTMVSVFPPPTAAMDAPVDVVMAVMREDALVLLASSAVTMVSVFPSPSGAME